MASHKIVSVSLTAIVLAVLLFGGYILVNPNWAYLKFREYLWQIIAVSALISYLWLHIARANMRRAFIALMLAIWASLVFP